MSTVTISTLSAIRASIRRNGVRNSSLRGISSSNSKISAPAISFSQGSRTLSTSSPALLSTNSLSQTSNTFGLNDKIKGDVTKREKSTVAAFDVNNNEQPEEAFPSIVIGPNGFIQPQGSFAEAQTQFLDPCPDAVESLLESLDNANMGIVAHYYMDVELQGVLQAVGLKQAESGNSRVAIADSLKMGDDAVKMCKDGATSIACLGVDFMAESVSAILDKNGFGHIPVYRLKAEAIGCSLAESAERDSYRAWLEMAAKNKKGPALHVVYINTSLETKAVSQSIVPTITCTSSNVLKTIMQASAQIGPDLQVYYGPDTYMGENLVTMMEAILAHQDADGNAIWDDDRISKELHPLHTRASLQKLREGMNVFPHGNCVVHHMFGADVVELVRNNYEDSFVTAHLEVPGEMFEIAMEKSLEGKGTVGSTSDILKFISEKVTEAASEEQQSEQPKQRRLKFILGTEAGMVTSIVRSVEGILQEKGSKLVEAEIVFPVASEAVTMVEGDADLSIVPGVSGGEGCSTAGGCATCPFMKMNDLDALSDVIEMVGNVRSNDSTSQADEIKLKGYLPPQRLKNKMLNGVKASELGVEAILYMRHFMSENSLSEELERRVRSIGA